MLRLAPDDGRPPVNKAARRYASLNLLMRTHGEQFEIRDGDGWKPFFVHGVNLGLALPGKFPSEFPTDSALYARWMREIAEMNANAVRIYTILPPQFYRALRGWNVTNPTKAIYIIHGVWTELPPGDDFDDPQFVSGYRDETRRTVDLLHGAADFAPRPGHAGGRYDADVSPWTLGYITGREWEPDAIVLYQEKRGKATTLNGRYLTIMKGTPIDVWMAAECDYLMSYEADTYNALRPAAYTNWPTTDPLKHPTETSYAEQMKLRGLRWDPEPGAPPPHEEDTIELDPSLVHSTPANLVGWFASYHIYPYYPDFMLYEPAYNQASSTLGRSNYFGYITALRKHHAGIPLIVSEFSVPTSRATAHLQPQGWNHGGLSEQEAAKINARLAADIREAGAAGEVFFSWIDEWFKPNWFSADFEIPAENRRQWLNVLSPEQNYGVIAIHAGRDGTTPLPGGDASKWTALKVLERGPLFGKADTSLVHMGNDEAYVYVAIEAPSLRGTPFPWPSERMQIAFDTFHPELGQTLLPTSGLRSEVGFEFLVELNGPTDAQLLVTPEYNPYVPARLTTGGDFFGEHFRRPILSRKRTDGQFDSLFALTNRPRYAHDGTFFPGSGVNMGRLVYARAADNTLADWYYDQNAGLLELRLPWGLLNVSDPSTNKVLYESDTTLALHPPDDCPPCSVLTGLPSDGMRVAVVALGGGPLLTGTIPALTPYGRFARSSFPTYTWPGWTEPTWHEYIKPTYGALRDLWAKW